MQKIKNPILCWIVILAVFIRPTPAQANPAVLAAVAVGALISGTLVAGSGVYSQAVYDSSKDAADAVTGAISREVLVAKMIGVAGQQVAYGVAGQVKLDFEKTCAWVMDHPLDYPKLSVPANAAAKYPFSVGDVYSVNNVHYKVTSIYITNEVGINGPADFVSQMPVSFSGGVYYGIRGTTQTFNPGATQGNIGYNLRPFNTIWRYTSIGFNYIVTQDPATNKNVVLTPPAFLPAYSHSLALQQEIDKMIFANPAAVVSKPVAITPAQIAAAQAAEAARVAAQAATAAQTAAAANPTDTNLQAAAAQAKALSDQAAIEASGEQAKLEATPDATTTTNDPPKVDTPPVSLSPPAAHVALDFSPLYALAGQATSHYPFNILSSAASYFSCLVAEPQPPSFTMPTVFGKTCSFDLAAWSPSASVIRGAMLFFFNILCMVAIVRRWS